MARPPRRSGLNPDALERIRRDLDQYTSILGRGTYQSVENDQPEYEYDYEDDYEDVTINKNISIDQQLLEYVEQSKLDKIFDTHEVDESLARFLTDLGPEVSTRVSMHRFFIDKEYYLKALTAGSPDSDITGNAVVEWHKRSNRTGNKATVYKGVSIKSYLEFVDSTSKGKFVKNWESLSYENISDLKSYSGPSSS